MLRFRFLTLAIFFAASAVFGLHVHQIHAATCDFAATEATNDFNLDANWSCGHTPTTGDLATVPAATTTVLTASSTFSELNATGTIVALGFNLTVTSTATVASTGSVTSTSGVLSFFGAVSSTGIIGTSTQTGDMFFGSSVQNNGTFNVGTGVATSTSTFTNAGTFNGGSGRLELLGSLDPTSAAGTFNAQTGTVRFAGSAAVQLLSSAIGANAFNNFELLKSAGGYLSLGASLTVNSIFSASGTNGELRAHTRTFLVTGASNIVSGNTVSSTSGSMTFTGPVSSTGNIISDTGSITMSSTLQNNSGATVSSTSGYMTFAGAITNAGTIGSNSGNMTFGASLTNSGSFLLGSGTASTTADLTNTGTVSTTAAGTLALRGGAAQSFGGSGSINVYDLLINKTAGTVTLAGNVTSTNDFTLTDGNLAIGSHRFAAIGDYSNDGGLVTIGDSGTLYHPLQLFYFSNSVLDGPVVDSYANGTDIYVDVSAPERNLDASTIESFTVTVTTTAAMGSDSETLTLVESTVNSGYFVNAASLFVSTGNTVTQSDNKLTIKVTGLGTASYTDSHNAANASSTTVTMTAGNLPAQAGSDTGGGAVGGGGSLPPLVTEQKSAVVTDNLNNLKALGIPVHALVKLPDDQNSSTQEDSAVYYIGTDGMRHAFPNPNIYFTWYQDFSQVQIVSLTQLSSIPLGKNVTYKPGVRMVKFTTDLKVYAVDKGGVLRYVTSEAVAVSLYGSAWNTKIDDLSDAFFSNYTFGKDVNSTADFNPAALQAAVKFPSESFGV